MSKVLIQYAGPLNSAAFQARALEGAKKGNGMIIVTGRGNMFLYGTATEVIEMIGGFPEAQSTWKNSHSDEESSAENTLYEGDAMKSLIDSDVVGKSKSFSLLLPHLF